MNRVDNLRKLAGESLERIEFSLSKIDKLSFKKALTKFLKVIKDEDKTKILKISNFDLLILFVNMLNDDLINYDEIMEMLAPFRTFIDEWDYKSCSKDLEILFKASNPNGGLLTRDCLDSFNNLHLPSELKDFRMKFAYQGMCAFLRLKRNISEVIALREEELTSRAPSLRNLNTKYVKVIKTPSEVYEGSEFKTFVSVFKDYREREDKNIAFNKNVLQSRKKCLNDLLRLIEDGQLDINFISFPDNWHRYFELEMLEELYFFVQDNLYLTYKSLQFSLREIAEKINETPFTTFLYERGLNPESLGNEKLAFFESIPNIVEKIKYLEELGLSLNDILLTHYEGLLFITEDKMKQVKFMVESGALSKNTVRNNLSKIFEDTSYKIIITNYEILKSLSLFGSMFYKDDILFKSTKEIKNMLDVLSEYKLSKNNFIFLLCNYEFLWIYDLVIEQGIKEEVFISICESESPINTIKRILIYKSIKEDYVTSGYLLKKEVLSERRFSCSNEDLDSYLSNVIPYLILQPLKGTIIGKTRENEEVANLDKLYRIDDVYLIGSVLISRPKFLRNYASCNCNKDYLLIALLSNSIVDEESYQRVLMDLKGQSLKK